VQARLLLPPRRADSEDAVGTLSATDEPLPPTDMPDGANTGAEDITSALGRGEAIAH